MSLQDIPGDTEGGGVFRNAGKAAGVTETDARAATCQLAPVIAIALKHRAAVALCP